MSNIVWTSQVQWVVFDVLNVGWVSCFVEFYTHDTFPVGKSIYSEKRSLEKEQQGASLKRDWAETSLQLSYALCQNLCARNNFIHHKIIFILSVLCFHTPGCHRCVCLNCAHTLLIVTAKWHHKYLTCETSLLLLLQQALLALLAVIIFVILDQVYKVSLHCWRSSFFAMSCLTSRRALPFLRVFSCHGRLFKNSGFWKAPRDNCIITENKFNWNELSIYI